MGHLVQVMVQGIRQLSLKEVQLEQEDNRRAKDIVKCSRQTYLYLADAETAAVCALHSGARPMARTAIHGPSWRFMRVSSDSHSTVTHVASMGHAGGAGICCCAANAKDSPGAYCLRYGQSQISAAFLLNKPVQSSFTIASHRQGHVGTF